MASSIGHRPSIGQHRLLGNGCTAALLRPDGEFDWWCAPAFDGTPLLWSLLDAEGGAARWPGARMLERSQEPAGATARTALSIGRRRIECHDALLAVEGGGSALVRLVRGPAGLVLTHELRVGGFDAPRSGWLGSASTVGDVGVHVDGGTSDVEGPCLRTTLTLPEDDRWCGLVVSAGAPVRFDVDVLSGALGQAEAVEGRRAATARLPRHHPQRAGDALAVLACCTFVQTGAVVASPTTSLPEAPGGDRQWDYRYTWLRDASLAVSVAALLGRGDLAKCYLSFVHAMAGPSGVPGGPLTDVRGAHVPDERIIADVAGWAGSQPVRTGNAAADQLQLDALGFVVEAVSVHVQTGGSLDHRTWRLVRAIADLVVDDDTEVSNGIWELRTPKRLLDADIGKWLALDRALWIARGWRPLTRRRSWRTTRDRLREQILGAIGEDGLLPQSYDEPPTADAAALLAVIFGLLDRRDPRASRLVDAVVARLDAAPFLYRYEPDETDGLQGREGAFLPASWWAVAALAAVGRLDEATARAEAMDRALPRLLSEEVNPEERHSLGNVPLVWSHMEAARTMYLLDAEHRRAHRGAAGLWAWRLATFVQLRARGALSDEALPTIEGG